MTRACPARAGAPYQVGWCSWYHYFHDVTEADLRANLALAGEWPFDVFQLDDGYQSAIGDWLTTNDVSLRRSRAGGGIRPRRQVAAGPVAGPLHRRPRLAGGHPAPGLARAVGRAAGPLLGMYNPPWGGGLDGFMYALDTTNPDVLAHLETVASALVDAGLDVPQARLHLRSVLRGSTGTTRPGHRPSACGPATTRSVAGPATMRSCSGAGCPCRTWWASSTATASGRTWRRRGRL